VKKFINILLLIVLSLIISYFLREVHVLLHWLADAHQFLLNKLALLFPANRWGRMLSVTLALVIIPFLIALIPAFIYWLFKRSAMPGYLVAVWVIWFVLITILAYK
jgi:hypothetical protein